MTTETTHEYASKGIAGTGLGLGIAGTALGLLNGGLGLMGTQGRTMYGTPPNGFGPMSNPETQCLLHEHDRIDDKYVNRNEFDLTQKLIARDNEIAVLKSDKYTDQKLVEVYTALNDKVNKVTEKINSDIKETNARIDFNKDAQQAINYQQGVCNATTASTIGCMQKSIENLYGVTKIVIPNTSVCPGWGDIKVSPLSA